MKLATVDFETTYSKEYSLSKMTTQEYIEDPRFQIIGVSIAYGEDEPQWYSFNNVQSYQLVLNPLQDYAVIAHNAAFDVAIMDKLGVRPKFIFDTLSMARPIHGLTVGGSLKALAEKYELGQKGTEVIMAMGKRLEDFSADELAQYGEYCKNDVRLTRALFGKLYKHTSKPELKLINQTMLAYTRPLVELDSKMLEKELEEVRAKKQALLDSTDFDKENLTSNQKFATALQLLGVKPGTKVSARTGKETFAFAKSDEFMKGLLNHRNPHVQALAAARLGVKSTIAESRAERLLRLSTMGPLRIPLSYCGAVTTWRWSGYDDLNMQNLPKKGHIRKALTAPEGHVLVGVDSSNIELRANHTMAGREASVQAFRDGRDMYVEFAASLFNVAEAEVDKDQRFLGKVAHLMLQYGAGAPKFQATCAAMGLEISDQRAREVVGLYRSMYGAIPRFWRECNRAVEAMLTGSEYEFGHGITIKTRKNMLLTPPQHYIQYPKLARVEDGFAYTSRKGRGTETVNLWGGKIVENLCQHVSRNIIGEQWLTIAERYPVVLQVHDEIVAVVPEDEAEQALKFMVKVMSTPPEWWPEIPLAAEGGYAKSYGEIEK